MQIGSLVAELAASEDRFHATVMTSVDGLLIVDGDGVARFANPAARALVKVEPGDQLGLPVGKDMSELDLVTAEGQRTVEMRTAATRWVGERATLVLLRDVTESRQAVSVLRESRLRYLLVAEASGDGVFDFDLVTGQTYYSQRLCQLLGREPDELPHDLLGWAGLVHPEDLPELTAAVTELRAGRVSRIEVQSRLTDAEGRERVVLQRAGALPDGNGNVVRIAGSLTDVTRQVRAEDRLRHQTLRDDLTGLANRRAVLELLDQSLAFGKRDQGSATALMFCDLDDFKAVNDTYGHAVGDLLLIEVAHRLTAAVRPYDNVGRLGGDEFVVILNAVGGEHEAAVVADRVLEAMTPPFTPAGESLAIGLSIGLQMADAGMAPGRLLTLADSKMYAAKRAGGGQVAD